MRERQLSLIEKWELDVESYNNVPKVKVSKPQCMSCKNFEKGNALYCKIFTDIEKPKMVLSCKKECDYYDNNDFLHIEIHNSRENKVYGGLFGFCIGDILGVPVEFSTREERKKDPINEMRAYGTYHQPFGTWSDDTSLTICLIDAINKGYSIERVAQNFQKFYENGEFTPHGEVFDVGNSTRESIIKLCKGYKLTECGGSREADNGNGSLMRSLPIAFYGEKLKEQELVNLVEEVSSLTHLHKRSRLACIFYVVFLIQIINGYKKDEALENTIAFIRNNCTKTYITEFSYFEKIFSKSIVDAKEDEIKSTGYVIDTLEAVIWTFYNADGYRDCVIKAVNLGGDTDTIAALVGGVAGIYYGVQDIPQKWIQTIAKKEELYSMFEQFCVITDV